MSSRSLQDMSSLRLEDVFSVTIFCLPSAGCFQYEFYKMSSKRAEALLEDEKTLG